MRNAVFIFTNIVATGLLPVNVFAGTLGRCQRDSRNSEQMLRIDRSHMVPERECETKTSVEPLPKLADEDGMRKQFLNVVKDDYLLESYFQILVKNAGKEVNAISLLQIF